jgi:hypothetical protein
MDETRDVDLGRRLETLAEPDHGSEYWETVRVQVAGAAAEDHRPSLGARLRRTVARRPLRLALAAAALAAVAAAAILSGLPHTRGPQSVSAREVLNRSLAFYSSGRTWQADVTLKFYSAYAASFMWQTTPRYRTVRQTVAVGADGSYRLTTHPGAPGGTQVKETTVLDAATGVLHTARGRTFRITTGWPLGPPDIWPGPIGPVDPGATLRAVAAARTLRLDETVIDGRAAWIVSCTKGETAGLPPTNVDWPVYTIAVDKMTWMAIRFSEERAGYRMLDVRLSRVRVDAPLSEDAFTLHASPGMTIKRADRGFRRIAPEDAAAMPGVMALTPGFVPAGYRPAGVAVAARSGTSNGVVTGLDVFELRYASGFDALTVSTRTIRDKWFSPDMDPIENRWEPSWSELARTEHTLKSGAFAGATARVLIAAPWSMPHLWAFKDGVLLVIAGGATEKELLAVAESLQLYPSPSPSASE